MYFLIHLYSYTASCMAEINEDCVKIVYRKRVFEHTYYKVGYHHNTLF